MYAFIPRASDPDISPFRASGRPGTEFTSLPNAAPVPCGETGNAAQRVWPSRPSRALLAQLVLCLFTSHMLVVICPSVG